MKSSLNHPTKCISVFSKLTIKTQERRHWRYSGVFIVNFEHISKLFLVFVLMTSNKKMLGGYLSFARKKTGHIIYHISAFCLCFFWTCLTILLVNMRSSIKYVRKIFRKTNISYPLIRTRRCAYQGVGNVSYSENFAYVLHEWAPSKKFPWLKKLLTLSSNWYLGILWTGVIINSAIVYFSRWSFNTLSMNLTNCGLVWAWRRASFESI